MQTGNCLLVINEFKSSIPKNGITPAETQFLVLAHSDNAGECAVKNLKISGTVTRSSADEKQRLCGKYIAKHNDPKRVTIESIWPGVNARLPEKFSEVVSKDGKPCFKDDGSSISAPAVSTDVVIGGKTYTKAELEKLVASQVKVSEEEVDEEKVVEEFKPKPVPAPTKK